METPQGLKYTSSDEWLSVEGKVAILGVTDYAQDQLSDVVFFEVNVEVGENVEKNSIVATIESVKAAADVKLPITGKVFEVNDELTNTPEQINTDPFGTAWILKVELSDPSELNVLMDADAYAKYCETRGH